MKHIRPFTYRFLLLLLCGGGLSFAYRQMRPVEAAPVLAVFIVINANDSGDGSLRKAILDANAMAGDDTITFATPFFSTPRTITLTTGELAINSNLTITGPGANLLTISGNNARRVFNLESGFTVSLSGMTITGGNAFDGGGIFNRSTLTVTNSTISGNTAALGGGIFNSGFNTLTVTNSTISGNTANGGGSGRGGGIENVGDLTVTNSTISGNRAPNGDNNGGGIYNNDANATITNSTITNNAAAGANSASGVFRQGGTVTVRNSIIAANQNNANQPDVVSSANPGGFTITSNGFNLIGNRGAVAFSQPGDQSGTGAAPLNPQLGPLQNNGGATPTHALLGGSPALNAGNASGSTTDQRGVPRVSGASADIGAVEMQALIVTNTTDSLGAGTLRQAITDANANGPGLDDIIFGIPPFNTTQSINLLTTLPDITSSVTINGPGANLLTVRRADNASDFRIFTIPAGVAQVAISGLTISNGRDTGPFGGGGIYSRSFLTLANVHVTGNQATSDGGESCWSSLRGYLPAARLAATRQTMAAAGLLSMAMCKLCVWKKAPSAGMPQPSAVVLRISPVVRAATSIADWK